MTFTLFTSNIIQSIYHNINHIYHKQNINIYERICFMMLSILSVINYSIGVKNNIDFRNTDKKDYIVYDKYKCKTQTDKNIVVIPTLIRNYDDKYKLMSAINSVTIDGSNIVIVVDDGSPLNMIEIDIKNVILVKHFENYGPESKKYRY